MYKNEKTDSCRRNLSRRNISTNQNKDPELETDENKIYSQGPTNKVFVFTPSLAKEFHDMQKFNLQRTVISNMCDSNCSTCIAVQFNISWFLIT